MKIAAPLCDDLKSVARRRIILDDKKAGGILCEKVEDRVIIGVGLNTNLKKVDLENAVSLFSKTREIIDNKE